MQVQDDFVIAGDGIGFHNANRDAADDTIVMRPFEIEQFRKPKIEVVKFSALGGQDLRIEQIHGPVIVRHGGEKRLGRVADMAEFHR